MRVLLAEDDPQLAEVVVEALTDCGHTVTHVRDHHQAEVRAGQEGWDCFVLDSFGPAHDAPDPENKRVFESLSAHAPVVLATGRQWAVRAKPEELGVAAIVPKPFDLDVLIAAVDAVGDRARRPG